MIEFIDLIRQSWGGVHGFELPVLGVWSYIFIAALVATEGPLTTLLGAAAAAAGYLDIRLVFLAAFIGNIVGDCLWYGIGLYSRDGTTWLLTRCPGLTDKHLTRLDDKMRSHATQAILFSKITFGLIVPTLIAAGRARVPVRRWFPAVLTAETLWTLLIVTLGYLGTGALARIGDGLRLFGFFSALVLVGATLWVTMRKLKDEESVPVPSVPAVPALPSVYDGVQPSR